jgi:hypothetical protein
VSQGALVPFQLKPQTLFSFAGLSRAAQSFLMLEYQQTFINNLTTFNIFPDNWTA